MEVAFYGALFCVDSRIDAQRFSSGSQLWGVSKVPMYGSRFRSIRCPSLNSPIKLSHRQERGCGQVTFYGEIGRLPFMGAISPFGPESNAVDDADRYPRMGTDKGSKLWEKSRPYCRAPRIPLAISIPFVCPHGRVPSWWQILCRVSRRGRER